MKKTKKILILKLKNFNISFYIRHNLVNCIIAEYAIIIFDRKKPQKLSIAYRCIGSTCTYIDISMSATLKNRKIQVSYLFMYAPMHRNRPRPFTQEKDAREVRGWKLTRGARESECQRSVALKSISAHRNSTSFSETGLLWTHAVGIGTALVSCVSEKYLKLWIYSGRSYRENRRFFGLPFMSFITSVEENIEAKRKYR